VVNVVRGICEKIEELVVGKKVLIYLPKYYSPKVYSIEEARDLDNFSMDQLYGTLTSYETKEFEKKSPKKEPNFKASTKEKYEASNQSSDIDDEEEFFLS
jgi:hypothetical protein